ncbi:Tautomerase/MIF [Vararia minispora EC-137]|uniref:Tautomerase/MIF n=1 Tax=Vararia minispora EC-137 TaxID=1314806 RepID=A0ACB8QPL4_9AGAM|nr:Tautomerase/MIF [Vararia minispora EC-137]
MTYQRFNTCFYLIQFPKLYNMPLLAITSNVKPADIKAFVLDFHKFAVKTLGKFDETTSISFNYQEHLSFGGTFEPAFILGITSLDNFSDEKNEAYSKVFFEYFQRTLGVPDHRGYIRFEDPGYAAIGYRSTTILGMQPK